MIAIEYRGETRRVRAHPITSVRSRTIIPHGHHSVSVPLPRTSMLEMDGVTSDKTRFIIGACASLRHLTQLHGPSSVMISPVELGCLQRVSQYLRMIYECDRPPRIRIVDGMVEVD